MISVSDPPSCTRTRKYARDDIPITVGTSERKWTWSGGAVAILGVTVTNDASPRGASHLRGYAPVHSTCEQPRSHPRTAARVQFFADFLFEEHNTCYPVSLTSSAWESAVAKPSENTSRDETAALTGPVAMRRKTPQRRLVADIRVWRDIGSAPPGPEQQDWANHGSLCMKNPRAEIFLPAKP